MIFLRKSPVILNKVFDDEIFVNFKQRLFDHPKPKDQFDSGFGRYCFMNEDVTNHMNMLLPKARELFDSPTLLPTYALVAHYEGKDANLFKHVDSNACTYTIDMCVYQNEPWDLYVEGIPYTLQENQALVYYGEDQEHWREDFPNPESQHVAMIFFHYAEPDHWFFTRGQEYYQVKFNIMTEEEYVAKYNR